MRFSFGNRKIEVDLQPALIALLVLGWTLFYYFSIINQPEGKESILFIKPLTVALVICFFLVLWGTIKIDRVKGAEAGPKEDAKPKDIGFLDHRRLFFAGSMIAYAAAVNLFGFMLPSILFLFIVFYYLGVRNPYILTIVPLSLPVLLAVIFVVLMKVPLALWPFGR